MGKRGPPPTPPELKVVRGTHRPGVDPEPQPAPAPDTRSLGLEPPAWLDDYAREIWAATVPQLEAIGMLSRVDQMQLAGYCDSVSLWKQAAESLDKDGLLLEVRGADGQVSSMRANPAATIRNQAIEKALKFAIEFGLTPSARARLQVSGGLPRRKTPKETDPGPVDSKAAKADRLFN